MASRFVRPEIAVLPISKGDTLTVKRRLTAGEQRAIYARSSSLGADGRLHSDPLRSGLALILAYLIDWTLTDDDGRVVPIRDKPLEEVEAVINSLDYGSFVEIKAAIEAHEDAMIAERAQEKKGQAGEKNGPAISPSPSDAAGASSGSAS